jgi:hypothetical protein
MSITKSFFDKELAELQHADLIKFFELPKKEGNNIEFKSYKDFAIQGTTKSSRDKEKLQKILSSVCAFLNTDGGLIIWGAPEGKPLEDEFEDSFWGNLTLVTMSIEPDQFMERVSSEIQPTPNGVKIKIIKDASGSFFYIIEINKSVFPPHQYKGTYYMRVEASTRVAPHQFVEAQMKRISIPKVQAHVVFGKPMFVVANILIPFTILISNESYYVHEKNLKYRILTTGCETIKDFKARRFEFQPGSDIVFDSADILLSSMSVYDRLCLATNETILKSHYHSIHIIITIWGELTPALVCEYEYKVLYATGNPLSANLTEVKKIENEYLFQQRENKKMAGLLVDQEIVDRESIEKWTVGITESVLYRSLRGQI